MVSCLDFALALAVLTTPSSAAADLPCSAEAVRRVGLALEIIDDREVRFMLARSEDVASDLHLLRERYAELQSAPSACDAARFPDREMIDALLAENRRYRQWLLERQHLFPRDQWIAEAIGECDQSYRIWDLCRDARCDYYYVSVRRQALMKLRDEIGAEAYYAGCLPPHIPVWRYSRID